MVNVYLKSKEIPTADIKNLLVQGQTGIEGIQFILPATMNGQDLTSDDFTWYLQFRNKNGLGEPVPLVKTVDGDSLHLPWVPNSLATQESGRLEIQLYAATVVDDVVTKQWVSLYATIYLTENLNPEDITQTEPTAYQTFLANMQAENDAAVAARDKAQKWAEEDEDVEVEAGKYSAKHHAVPGHRMRLGVTPTESDIKPVLEYMQELRDLPSQEGWPENITWPTEP